MGSLIEAVGGIVQEELDRIAKEIEEQMKAEAVGKKAHIRTGLAQASIHIEDIGTGSVFGAGRFIGADADFDSQGDGNGGTHLYYMNYGNGGSGRIIKPKRKKALALKDGTLAPYVRGYSGKHFIEKIADKYR